MNERQNLHRRFLIYFFVPFLCTSTYVYNILYIVFSCVEREIFFPPNSTNFCYCFRFSPIPPAHFVFFFLSFTIVHVRQRELFDVHTRVSSECISSSRSSLHTFVICYHHFPVQPRGHSSLRRFVCGRRRRRQTSKTNRFETSTGKLFTTQRYTRSVYYTILKTYVYYLLYTRSYNIICVIYECFNVCIILIYNIRVWYMYTK